MAIVYGANYGAPTLDLNFARNKSLIDTVTGRNLVTFTRAQTAREATYVGADGLIKSAVANEARFDHNPVTGECLGLLVEEARTNLITYSEQFDNAAWSKQTNTTVTANTHVAPDGTTTADTINAIGNEIIGNAAVTASTTYTVSVFIRKTTGATIFPMLAVNVFTSGAQRIFNTNTGQLVVRTAALNTGIQCESVGSYWRVSYSGNVGSNTTLSFLIYAAGSTDGSNYSGGFTGSIIAWGAQVEAGAFPTSYIPTVASTVTRAADVASMTGSNFSSWYNQSEGTMYLKAVSKAEQYLLEIPTTGGGNYHVIAINSARAQLATVNTTTQASIFSPVGSYNLNVANSVCTAWTQDSFAITSNGTTVANDTSGTVPTVDLLAIGRRNLGGANYSCSTFARLTYYPTRLQDFQLQQLTK